MICTQNKATCRPIATHFKINSNQVSNFSIPVLFVILETASNWHYSPPYVIEPIEILKLLM